VATNSGKNALNWFNLLGISVALAMDALAVSIAAGLSVAPVTPRHTFRIAFHFGLFQFMMPVFGWLAGKEMAVYIRAYDHWVAFALLALVGGKMLAESCGHKDITHKADPTRGMTLVTLSVATSIDALAVGVGMAFMRQGISIWIVCAVIGVVAAALSALGIGLGNRCGTRCGRWAEAAGGCVLLSIGVKILLCDLYG